MRRLSSPSTAPTQTHRSWATQSVSRPRPATTSPRQTSPDPSRHQHLLHPGQTEVVRAATRPFAKRQPRNYTALTPTPPSWVTPSASKQSRVTMSPRRARRGLTLTDRVSSSSSRRELKEDRRSYEDLEAAGRPADGKAKVDWSSFFTGVVLGFISRGHASPANSQYRPGKPYP